VHKGKEKGGGPPAKPGKRKGERSSLPYTDAARGRKKGKKKGGMSPQAREKKASKPAGFSILGITKRKKEGASPIVPQDLQKNGAELAPYPPGGGRL